MESSGQGKIKRILKLGISLGFYCASYVWPLVRRWRGVPAKGICVILYYHAVPSQQRARFARQMDLLVRCAKPIGIDGVPPLDGGARYAAVTFDDGFESVFENALPELVKRQIPATIFVISDALGQKPGWEGYPERTVSVEQLRKLPADLITIGSHTMTHPFLPAMSEKEARRELSGSRARLEQMLNRKIKLFSFPYGAFNQNLVEWCRDAGYQRVFTTLPVPAFNDPKEFVTGRVWADPTDWALEFRLKLSGAYRWLPLAFALKGRLVSSP